MNDAIRYRAIDGSSYVSHLQALYSVFGDDDNSFKADNRRVNNPHVGHGMRPGMIGCALSHMQLWRTISMDADHDPDVCTLILEDDVTFGGDFRQRWTDTHAQLHQDKRWDIVFLGYTDHDDAHDAYRDWYVMPELNITYLTPGPRSYGAGLFAYCIRPRAASYLWQRAVRGRVYQPIDWFVFDAISKSEVVAYAFSPQIISTTYAQADGSNTHTPYPVDLVRWHASMQPHMIT